MSLFKWLKRGSPSGPVDLLSEAFIADPYPFYQQIENAGGFAESTPAGWIVTGHDRIRRALSHPGFGNTPSRFSALNPKNARKHVAASVASNTLPFVDGARHQTLRKATGSSIFKAIQNYQPTLANVAQASLKDARNVRDFAGLFAVNSTLDFLGLPRWEAAKTRGFTDAFFRLFAPITSAADLAETNRRLDQFRDAVAADVQKSESLFSKWCAHISPQEATDMTMLLLADGVENVEAGLQSGTIALARQPNLVIAVTEWTKFAMEVLRWDSPAQILPRVCIENTEFDGRSFSEGTPIFLALGAANRDIAIFENPGTLCPDRDTSAAIVFGAGRHSCIGQGLAIAQIAAGLEILAGAGRIQDFAKVTPKYQKRFGHRWPDLTKT